MTIPNFTLTSLTGTPFSPQDHLGKIILLNFWSAECPWSKRADDTLTDLLSEWGDEVVYAAIASNANESIEEIERVSVERDIHLVLHDSQQEAAKLLGAEMTPHIFIFNRAGELAYQGAFDDVTFRQRTPTQCYVYDAIEALLHERPLEINEAPAYGCTIVYHAE
jgi:thiol-disulfide isomerase/thioredoxin